MKTIEIAKDYSSYLGGRYPEDGKGNATEFRQRFLVPVLKNKERVTISFDGVSGIPVSFLEEAFGCLISKEGFSLNEVLDAFEISPAPFVLSRYPIMVERIVRAAATESVE